MITKLLLWIIMSYGLMNIMVYGSIFAFFRNFLKKWGYTDITPGHPKYPFHQLGAFMSDMISCPMCFSFHGGWFLSLVIFSPTYCLFTTPLWISWFFDGIISSGAVWAINSVIEWFEVNRPK